MRTVAIISRKGGAGKTNIAVHLAACAEGKGVRAGIVDLDDAPAAVGADADGDLRAVFDAVLDQVADGALGERGAKRQRDPGRGFEGDVPAEVA